MGTGSKAARWLLHLEVKSFAVLVPVPLSQQAPRRNVAQRSQPIQHEATP
jgi:hypothetical protein